MEIDIKELARQLKLNEQTLLSLAQRIGIENGLVEESNIVMLFAYIINDKQNFYNDELKGKEMELKQFHKKLKQKKMELETSEKNEADKLKEKLIQDELNHTTKLKELEIKTLTTLNNDFLANMQEEHNKVKSKADESLQKELKLMARQEEIERSKKIFNQEKELFESQKEKLLSEYKQELEIDKEIFFNKMQEEKVKRREAINASMEELYNNKEKELNEKAEDLIQKKSELEIKRIEITAKEKSLALQGDLLYKQEKEKVEQEVKNYQEKVNSFEKQNQIMRVELSDLREEFEIDDKIKGRELSRELDEKLRELSSLKKLLDDMTEKKNDLQLQKENDFNSFEKQNTSLYQENQELKISNKGVESLKTQNAMLEDKVLSSDNYIEVLKGQKRKLTEELDSIFAQGKEQELRIEDIKSKPFKKIRLESKIDTDEEIKYLDSIESNMSKYGVKYPRRLLYAFHTALKSAEFSPLSVLSGVSGTGKSELPKLYAHFGGFNFLAEAVQPTWDSPESLIGYYNTMESKFDATNILKFLFQTSQSRTDAEFGFKESMNMILLDEMNLAHIELYFAEFLSKFEQRRGNDGVYLDIPVGVDMKEQLLLDNNLLWIGTMNEDETTKSLSDKVLDRSFSINFPRPDKLLSRAKLKTLNEIKEFEYLDRKTWDKWIQKESLFTGANSEIIQKFKDISNNINECLAPTGRAIGHRVWQSMEYYINNHPLVIQSQNNEDDLIKNAKLAFEEQLVQKIMHL